MTLVHKFLEPTDGVLDWISVIHTRALEKIDALRASEGSVDLGDALRQVFRPRRSG